MKISQSKAARTVLLIGILSSAPVYGVTAKELDEKEAFLNDQAKRMDEVGRTHGQLKHIRDHTIQTVFKSMIRQWYSDADAWLNGWIEINTNLADSDKLKDVRTAEATTGLIVDKLNELGAFKRRIEEIHAAGDTIAQELNSIRILPDNYIDVVQNSGSDDYSAQIRLMNSQIAEAKKQLREMRSQLSLDSHAQLLAYGEKMRDKVSARIKILALTYPDLEAIVAKIQFAMFTMRAIDARIQAVMDAEGPVEAAVATNRIHEAIDANALLIAKAEALRTEILANGALLPEVKDNAVKRINDALTRWSSRMDRYRSGDGQLRALGEDLLIANYIDTIKSGKKNCTDPAAPDFVPPWNPDHLDCNLLRTVVGFTPRQLRAMDISYTRYIETLLTKIKQGPVRIGKAP